MPMAVPHATSESNRRQHLPIPWWFGGAVLFLLTRVVLLPPMQPTSDIGNYVRFVQESEAARQRGLSFYEVHTQQIDHDTRAAAAAGQLIGTLDEYRDVEYPPLAVAVMRLPLLWQERVAPNEPRFEEPYRCAYRRGLAIVDLALFVLVMFALKRWQLGEPGFRLVLFVAATVPLWHLLYDRLDLIQVLLVLGSLVLLCSRTTYVWSFTVLAAAIHFKFVPLVLAPVWIVGALPLGLSARRLAVAVAERTVVLVAFCAIIGLPFLLADGTQCLGFLNYHRNRPLEMNALWATPPLVLRHFGVPAEVSYAYGSINVHSPLTPALRSLATVATLAALGACAVAVVAAYRRRSAAWPTADHPRLAQRFSGDIVLFTFLMQLLFIVTNKVFSPQYLLWLAPLVVLLPFAGVHWRRLAWVFILIGIVTTVLVPFLAVFDMMDPAAAPTVPRTFKHPSTRMVILLVVRGLLLVGLTVQTIVFARRWFVASATSGSDCSRC